MSFPLRALFRSGIDHSGCIHSQSNHAIWVSPSPSHVIGHKAKGKVLSYLKSFPMPYELSW